MCAALARAHANNHYSHRLGAPRCCGGRQTRDFSQWTVTDSPGTVCFQREVHEEHSTAVAHANFASRDSAHPDAVAADQAGRGSQPAIADKVVQQRLLVRHCQLRLHPMPPTHRHVCNTALDQPVFAGEAVHRLLVRHHQLCLRLNLTSPITSTCVTLSLTLPANTRTGSCLRGLAYLGCWRALRGLRGLRLSLRLREVEVERRR